MTSIWAFELTYPIRLIVSNRKKQLHWAFIAQVEKFWERLKFEIIFQEVPFKCNGTRFAFESIFKMIFPGVRRKKEKKEAISKSKFILNGNLNKENIDKTDRYASRGDCFTRKSCKLRVLNSRPASNIFTFRKSTWRSRC